MTAGRKMSLLFLGLLVCVSATGSGARAAGAGEAAGVGAPGYDYQVILVPGSTATMVSGINARGDVVGRHFAGGRWYGYLFRQGRFETLDVPGSTATFANGINERGEIAGTYQLDGVWLGFVLRHGHFTTIEFPGAVVTRIWDINSNGALAGEYQLAVPGTTYAFVWRAGVFTELDIPNSTMSAGFGINNRGEVAGHYRLADPEAPGGSTKMMGYVWRDGQLTHVDHPGAAGLGMSCLLGIGVHGEGLGHYLDPATKKVFGFLWLDGVFGPDLQVPGMDETYPVVITPSGVIGGYLWYYDPTTQVWQQRGFIATPRRR
jgi:uncharacterized membrane protein